MSSHAQSSFLIQLREKRKKEEEREKEKEREYLSSQWSKDLGEAELRPSVLKIFKSLHSLGNSAKKAYDRKLRNHRRTKRAR